MNTPLSPNSVVDDIVVSLDYTLTVEGQLVDASEENEPIEFIQGYQNIIPGLEKQLYGMAVGDSKEVLVAPADGYGSIDQEAFMDVPRKEFPADMALEIGLELALQQPDGQVLHATVVEINDETVKLDFNHPLAGKELLFRVTVVGLRPASAEEIAHGHVHGPHGEEDDEDEEDLDGDFDEEVLEDEEELESDAEEDE